MKISESRMTTSSPVRTCASTQHNPQTTDTPLTQPSTNVSLVAFSSFRYPSAIDGPVTTSSPSSPSPQSAPSGRTTRAATPGMICPALPTAPIFCAPPRKVIVAHVSVMPGCNS
ncbi:unnamed protein product [Mycena citricolor]|uniref:Uncharacterized protein n=1 Tax=Mycena citricolor TaxID=2018698 RepID=A0AAD2HPX2_9AGAR|nr:unnamed protein product [Mycena citricolor]